MNQGVLLALLAVGAYYLLSNGTGIGNTGKPTYYNMQKQVINSIPCGQSITFDVPGYSEVWLTRTKNGVQDFNAPYAVPIPPYVLNCVTDVGTYVVTAYTLVNGTSKGQLLGSTTFTVTQS